jgi:hypothetical protein
MSARQRARDPSYGLMLAAAMRFCYVCKRAGVV